MVIMPVFDIFSKRQKRLRGEVPDVYQYEDFPQSLRIQVIQIITDAFGEVKFLDSDSARAYATVRRILCREYGVFALSKDGDADTSSSYDILTFLLQSNEYEKILDVIETSLLVLEEFSKRTALRESSISRTPNAIIEEINERFFEHGLGYQYESGKIIRIDSKLIHTEVVKPTLAVLSNKMYEGANEEYLTAHEHYRHGRNKDCLTWCLKAFESVMKAICEKHKWAYNKGDTAKRLLDICFDKGLIPSFLLSHYSALRSSLESGIPTVRNELGGHGQGSTPVEVPPYLAAYLLHLTATSILLLADAEKALK
jgi:hypothetical protein